MGIGRRVVLAGAGGAALRFGTGLAVGIPYKVIAMCENIGGAEEMTVRKSAYISRNLRVWAPG
jgi:hypothetical protein